MTALHHLLLENRAPCIITLRLVFRLHGANSNLAEHTAHHHQTQPGGETLFVFTDEKNVICSNLL